MVIESPISDRFIWLEAVSAERNIARRYAIEASCDLFGATIVEHSWGRIGRKGQSRKLSFADRNGADRCVAALLRRRQSSHRRIGVAYREIPTSAMCSPFWVAGAEHLDLRLTTRQWGQPGL